MYDPSAISGRTALITGASSGIGEEFARQLAARGANLVLVARSIDKLDALAASLRAEHRVDVFTEGIDLSTADAPERLFGRVTELGLSVDLLVNNAGFSSLGPVADMDPEQAGPVVNLNVKTVLENTVRFLPGMVSRGGGVIINIAGTGAFQPAPYMAARTASAAFVLSFTQAVSAENADTGVRVFALCPGLTDTPMTSGQNYPGTMRTPEQVVNTALKALSSRKASVVDGRLNTVMARVGSRLPEPLLLSMASRVMKRTTATS
ncbi:SDR family NAD(P)-dependent oxidoreductase [Streptomyces sp. NPDC057137]|uniref:SDR family NAD(P)-dependent oxidoreductase n=1 Tax=Streptomyces sp. NPDC057137 TaxID=3346030 RepID=UPI003628119E